MARTRTQRLDAPERPPLVRPGVRSIVYWLVGADVALYGTAGLYFGVIR